VADIYLVGARNVTPPRLSVDDSDLSDFPGALPDTLKRDGYAAAAEVRFTGGNHISRPFIHGMPDSWLESTNGINFTLTADARAAVNAYLVFLIAQGVWQVRGFATALTPDTSTIKGIAFVAGAPVFTLNGAAPAPNATIKVTGCKGYRANQYNGSWKVVSVTGQDCTVASNKPLDPTAIYAPNTGKWRTSTGGNWEYPAITTGTILKAGSKKIGRPSFAPRGRRSKSGR
jgi:hypothetical protein